MLLTVFAYFSTSLTINDSVAPPPETYLPSHIIYYQAETPFSKALPRSSRIALVAPLNTTVTRLLLT